MEVSWLEIEYKCGKIGIMEWDEYDHFIIVLNNTPLDEHEIVEIVERHETEVIKVWWNRQQMEASV